MTDTSSAVHALFDRDEIRDVLESSFYRAEPEPARIERPAVLRAEDVKKRARPTRKRARKPKPDHYDVICISMYVEDLRALDEKVATLKEKGHRRMTRSALIRYALDRLSVEDVPSPVF